MMKCHQMTLERTLCRGRPRADNAFRDAAPDSVFLVCVLLPFFGMRDLISFPFRRKNRSAPCRLLQCMRSSNLRHFLGRRRISNLRLRASNPFSAIRHQSDNRHRLAVRSNIAVVSDRLSSEIGSDSLSNAAGMVHRRAALLAILTFATGCVSTGTLGIITKSGANPTELITGTHPYKELGPHLVARAGILLLRSFRSEMDLSRQP